jgi:hypothetical protein
MPTESAEVFVVGSKGETYGPKVPELLGPFARAVGCNRTPLHVLCGAEGTTIGTLIYTTALWVRALGPRYVLFTAHQPKVVSVGSVQEAIVDHFYAIRQLGENPHSADPVCAAWGAGISGAHFIDYGCKPRETLVVSITRSLPSAIHPSAVYPSASVSEFLRYLRAEAGGHGERGQRELLKERARRMMLTVPRDIVRQRESSPGRPAERWIGDEWRLPWSPRPRSCAEQIRFERAERVRG